MKSKPMNADMRPFAEVNIPGPVGRLVHRINNMHPVYWLLLTAIVFAIFIWFIPHSIWSMLWRGVGAQKYTVAMLGAFGLLAFSLVWSTGQKIDVWVFMLFNRRWKRPRWLDWIMLCYTQIGNGIFAYAVAFVLFLRVEHVMAYELVFGTLTLWLVVELIKTLIRRQRPYSKLNDIRIIGTRERGTSFPSGHTSQAFFMASLMFHYIDNGVWVAALLYSVALLVGITRMYVGMHYPRDVLGGAILGTSWGLIGMIINSYIFTELNLH